MQKIDHLFLVLQFQTQIYKKNGMEFQKFFEEVMEKSSPGFRKINPDGGDGGNDGYFPDKGEYYQVYSPEEPKISVTEAAKKLKTDFYKLQNTWEEISKIRKYFFVFNDKFSGSSIKLERTISELQKEYPQIQFSLFLSVDLQSVFLRLPDTSMTELGITVDTRQTFSVVSGLLSQVRCELNKEHIFYAKQLLENISKAISTINDEKLTFEFELLEARCIYKSERIAEAKEYYLKLVSVCGNDPRPLLFIADLFFSEKNHEDSRTYLIKAEAIDNQHWFLHYQKLFQKMAEGEVISNTELELGTKFDDPIIKSAFYRIYSMYYEDLGMKEKADSYIEQSILLAKDLFMNYYIKSVLIKMRILKEYDIPMKESLAKDLLSLTEEINNKFNKNDELSVRGKTLLNSNKLVAYIFLQQPVHFEKIAKEIIESIYFCNFDTQIEHIIADTLRIVLLPEPEFNKLVDYLKISYVELSEELSTALLLQFDAKLTIFNEGKMFFSDKNQLRVYGIIRLLESKEIKPIVEFFANNPAYLVNLPNTFAAMPDLRRNIIDGLPDNNDKVRIQLSLLLNDSGRDLEEAYKLITKLDIEKLSYLECKPLLQIISRKGAWEIEIVLLQKLIEKEQNENEISNLKLLLLECYRIAKNYPDYLSLGQDILLINKQKRFIGNENFEAVLANTVLACFELGKVNEKTLKIAQEILAEYPLENPSYNFRIGIQAVLSLKLQKYQKALDCIIDAVKQRQNLSSQEYAKLYFILAIQIGNKISFNLDSLTRTGSDTFVKINGKEEWYYLGTQNGLDAVCISERNQKYNFLVDKSQGEKVIYQTNYKSTPLIEEIELIYTIEQYIIWRCLTSFNLLSRNGDLEGVQLIEVPEIAGSLNFSFLEKIMGDLNKDSEPFFDLFCNGGIPLSLLAITEGGLLHAIGKIQSEERGFITINSGLPAEMCKETLLVLNVLKNNPVFYIDATSTFFLSENGLLLDIFDCLPNMRISQSVISFLYNIMDRIKDKDGTGSLSYVKGQLKYLPDNSEMRNKIDRNISKSIQLFESRPQNIGFISTVNKVDCKSERTVPAELCDATVLAKRDNAPVLTDDYLFVMFNAVDSKQSPPPCFSSISLIKALFLKGEVSFRQYISYACYLSSYRCRKIPLILDDLQNIIFNDEVFTPEELNYLNLPLLLSKEYGWEPIDVYSIIGSFIRWIILNDSINSEDTEKTIEIILNCLPKNYEKTKFASEVIGRFEHDYEQNKVYAGSVMSSELIESKIWLLRSTGILSKECK